MVYYATDSRLQLAREHADLLPLMRGIKAVLDPEGILNPGKLLPAAG